ncbi:hypothetical protein BS78_01G018300 [Paspalum vaginatum]|nr:hypothetical protein BS78_01G018300 [Paspalum vaginatum]
MAVPVPAYKREQAEKLCREAEELFLAGNIPGAHRRAARAMRLCPTLPGVANAHAAYEVHASAGSGWRAVLGIHRGGGDDATHDAIKKQYRRMALLVHPDKTSCAAAEGAFKLLGNACDEALSPGAGAGLPVRDTRPRYAAPPYVPPAAPRPPMRPMYVPQREVVLVYCPFCKNEYRAKIGRLERHAGMKCARCPEWLSPPWQKKPPAKKEPPAGPGRQLFQCPAKCPECDAQYTSMVSVGQWCLRCKACNKAAMISVQGPDKATATIRRRA